MEFSFHDGLTYRNLTMTLDEDSFRYEGISEGGRPFLTIAWNRGHDERILIDGTAFLFPSNSVACLIDRQSFQISASSNMVFWQFDKPMFCIEENDSQVSCVGFLFYGPSEFAPIKLNAEDERHLLLILDMFSSEFGHEDSVKGEMLRVLLKRLILKLTNLAKEQYVGIEIKNADLDMIRQFNVLVERNFRVKHKVTEYADLLFKSPKTLTNLFAIYPSKSPLRVIHERLVLEAKRLLMYTEKSVKEISADLGFEEVSHFSRLFKQTSGNSPQEFRRAVHQDFYVSTAS